MKYRLELNSPVVEKFAGETLIDSLTRRFTYHDRGYWLERVISGQVRVDGEVSTADHLLQVGENVQFAIDDHTEPDLDTDYKKIWENEFLILVSKPADLPVHSSRRIFFQTMTAILRRDENMPQLNPMHRLDRETSGLMLYMKKSFNSKSWRRNPRQAIGGKFYLAVVNGVFEHENQVIDAPLRETGLPPVRYRMIVAEDGKPAITVISKVQSSESHSLLLIKLESGRKHQIRAHLEHAGFPIVGDKLYSHDARYFLKRCEDDLTEEDLIQIGATHHLLHAWALEVRLPGEEEQIFFSDHFSPSWQQYLATFKNWRELAQEKLKLLQDYVYQAN